MSKKILVTGGNGFIGGYLVEYYTTRNFQVHSLDIHKESKYDVYNYYSTDITNIDNVLSIDNSFDIIFHCAGSASVLHSTENPIDDFIINVQGTLNMLEFVRKSGSHSFIFLSTVSVFDREGELPLTEISVKKATSPYGAGKMASESYCQAYYRTYGIDTRIARIFNTYGPGMSHLFIADVMRKIKRAKTEIVIGGSGNQIRDYVYISDLIKALTIIAEKGQPGEDYNICSGKNVTLFEITEMLLQKMKRNDLKIICDGKSYPGDIEKWYGTPKKLNSLGFTPETGLEKGLEKVINSWKG